MGLFSKGSSTLTPAQAQLAKIAGESQAHFRRTWLPVQQYFAQNVLGTESGLSAMEQGQQAATARAKGTEGTLKAAEQTTARAGLGSGRSVLGLGAGSTETAGGTGLATTAGELQAKKAYEEGLAKVLSLGQGDEALAQQGLSAAAGAQAPQVQQQVTQALQQQQGLGQIAGLAGALGRGYGGGAYGAGDLANYGKGGNYPGSDDTSGLGSNLAPENQ